jgi:hypothetical protein
MRNATETPGTTPDVESPAEDPIDGKPDMNLPGADHPKPAPDQRAPDQPAPDQRAPDQDDDKPERLGERIAEGPGGAIASGEPDLLPNVEVPEATM